MPWLLALPLLLGMAKSEYRFHRPIETAEGWARLELPTDVLDGSRPGRVDLRIATEAGEEVPYAFESSLATGKTRLPLVNVETVPERETTAMVDRGDDPGWADRLTVVVEEDELIKPVVVEASPDKVRWAEIGRGSLFATVSGRSTEVRCTASDRRYWRFRFDDRNSRPVHPRAVVIEQAERKRPSHKLAVEYQLQRQEEPSFSTYLVSLASSQLPISRIEVVTDEPAFSRRARVYERVWFRDEVSRRLLGDGLLQRSPGGPESLSISMTEPTGKHLELDIEESAGLGLRISAMSVVVEPPELVFFARPGAKLELLYGSPQAPRPAYDLANALAKGRPPTFARASLGTVVDEGVKPQPPTLAPRGGLVEIGAWKWQEPIELPPRGTAAYLDIDRPAGSESDLRIVDQARRQVPYVVEAHARKAELPVTFRAEPKGGDTNLELADIDARKAMTAIVLRVTSPRYFSRRVTVAEPTFDARGPTGERILGSADIVQAAESPPAPFRIPIAAPATARMRVHIANGDNAPLEVANVAIEVARRRIDFLFAPGDRLTLLSDNPKASPPSYDLALVAKQIFSTPAEAARLAEPSRVQPIAAKTPAWFFIFVVAAALVLLLVLVRTLRGDPTKLSSPP